MTFSGVHAEETHILPKLASSIQLQGLTSGLLIGAAGNHSAPLESVARSLLSGEVDCSPFGTYMVVDEARGRAVIQRGSASNIPIYITDRQTSEFSVSHSARTVRRSGVNALALKCYLADQYLPVGGGLYNDGLRLAPGDMWEFDRAKVAYRPARKAITGSSTDEYTDSSLDALYEGVLEDVHGHQNVSVLFSGGLDSSAIAWALAKAGVETHLLYMDFTSTAPLLKSEMARAVEIARRLNLPFHTIPVHLGDIEPSEVFGTAVQAPNNFLSAPGVRQAAKVAVELGSTALCMGSFGDTLWNGSHQDPFYAALRATLRGDLPTVLAWLGTQRNLSQLSRLRGIADGFRIASRLVGRSESEVVGSIDRKCTRRVAVPRLGGMYAYSLAERHLRTELDSVHLEFWQHDLMVGSLELHDPLRHPRIWASIWNLPADRRQVIIGATVVGKYEWRRLLKDYFPTTCHEGDRVGYKQLADAYLEMFGDEIRSRFRRSTLADRGVVDAKLLRRYGSSVAGFRSAHPTGILRLLGADYWLERVDRMRVS